MEYFSNKEAFKQFLRTMKVIVLLLLLCVGSVFANKADAQSRRVTITSSNVTARQIIKEIEQQTDYLFVYNEKDVDLGRIVSVDAKEEAVSKVLNSIFKGTQINYVVEGTNIMLTSNSVQSIKQNSNKITGKIVDSNGDPIIGANVLVKGTTNGAITDMDGNFTLEASPVSVLEISYIGYKSLEVAVDGKSFLTITLVEDAETLDEVVVVGYGVMKKSDLTGASTSVKEETLSQRSISSFGQALEGHVSGANITTNSGRPGGRVTMRIRGNSSISVTNDPLYVIDGVIMNVSTLSNGSSPIDYLNPGDIENVEVLKDASATAIYGARGANGVIMITTKKGTQNKGALVRYDADFSLNTLPRKLEVLNSREFLAVEELAYQNAAKYDPEGWAKGNYTNPKLKRTNPLLFDSSGNPLYDTDWQNEAIRTAFSTNHQLSVSYSRNGNNYGMSLGFRDDNGLIVQSWLKRYSGRFYMDSEVNKWLKFGGSLSYTYTKERQLDSMGDGGITIGRQMIEELPIIPVKYPDGTWGGNKDYPGMEGGDSPVNIANNLDRRLTTQNMLGNAYAEIKFIPELTFRSMVGTNIIHQRQDYYGGRELIWISSPNGYASISNNQNTSWQFENYLTYIKEFAQKHSLTAMAGLSWQHVNNNYSSSSNSGFNDDFFKYNNIGVGTGPSVSSTANAYGLNSYFARINYGFDNRYLITATARLDGSSKFGSDNRYAFFPSVGLGWRIDQEKFMENAKSFSNLKLHASVGITGNSETGAYASQGALGNYTIVLNDTKATGIGISTLANPDLKWEKTMQYDLGLDLGLFQNRITAIIDAYYKKTTNMLLNSPIPASSGYTSITENIGSMRNQGIELSIETQNIQTKDFTWSSSFNFSCNSNKVLSLGIGNDDIFPGPDILSSTNNIIRVGEPVGSFYGYKRLGTWSTDEEVEAAKYGKLPGDLKLWDKNGDGQINDEDRIILGKGIPDGYGSFTNRFTYKNFDLLVDIQYTYGNDILDISKHSAEDRTGIANSYKTVLDAWTPEHQNTMIAQIRPTSAGYTTNIDSHFVEDGSFIRGRNLVLGYNFNQDLLKKIFLKQLRVYFSVQNFFLITKYNGYDPEVSDATQTFAQGITVFGYPKARTFTLGFSLTL